MYIEQPPGYVAQWNMRFVYRGKQFMASSKVRVSGLRSSVVLLLLVIFDAVLLITLFSTDGQLVAV